MASHVDTSALITGFGTAVKRATSAGGSSFEGVFECLAWAGAVRDRLAQTKQAIPPILNGLWYVRNLALHQGADVVAIIAAYGSGTYGAASYGGVTFGGGQPLGSSEVFPPRNVLPVGKSRKGALDYDALVAGQLVADVLQRAVAAL